MKAKPWKDPVVEYYKQFVDREALRENLKLTVEERLLKHQRALAKYKERRYAGQGVRVIKGKYQRRRMVKKSKVSHEGLKI